MSNPKKNVQEDNLLQTILRLPLDILLKIWEFIGKIRQNRSGFIGFLGLVAYAILTFIMPSIVEFDNEPKLDEITGPLGSRIQLAVHVDDADNYFTFEDLAGKTVGVVSQTGGPILIEPYEDTNLKWNPSAGVADGQVPVSKRA